MNTEDRLHKLERLTQFMLARINVQELVIGALISSHPNPDEASAQLRKASEAGLVQHLFDAHVSDEVRNLIQKELADFIWIAEQRQKPRAD